MNSYLVLVRGGGPGYAKLSEPEQQALYGKWGAYIEQLTKSGNWVKGQPIDESGRLLCDRREPAEGVVGEPDVAVGGYFILEAANYDEALKLCGTCPSIDIGGKLEIRQTVDM
jgi:hypothetical protein